MHFENVALQCGVVLPDVKLVYKTYGKLNNAGDNCILLPTSFVTSDVAYAQLIGRARALNPAKYFIVVLNLLGNGLSSSPSNTSAPFHGNQFPNVSIADNVQIQYQLLTEKLKVKQIALIFGWSMGATLGYAFAATYPQMVRGLLAVCGSAICWPLHNVMQQGAILALTADPNVGAGNYNLVPEAGLRAIGRFFAGWMYSAAFYRDQLYRSLGYESAEALLASMEKYYLTRDANNLLILISTMRNSRIELQELQNITAKTIVMPCDHDMFITLDEARIETALIPNAELRPIYSAHGHCAGAPGYVSDATLFMEQAIRELLVR